MIDAQPRRLPQVDLRQVEANGITMNVAVAGSGPVVVLLHGFPHTWHVWSPVIALLAERYRVIAPDLRGFGGSERTPDGYDVNTLAADVDGVLSASSVSTAAVVAIDAGAPVAVRLALLRPRRICALVVMEAVVGSLPGAEKFVAGGPPWWFGFHAVPGLAERVLAGHEAEYVDWFLETGTRGRGVPTEIARRSCRPSARRGAEGPALVLPGDARKRPPAPGGVRRRSAHHADDGDRRPSRRWRARTPAAPVRRRPDRPRRQRLRPHHPARPAG